MRKIVYLLVLSLAFLAHSPPADAGGFRGGGGSMHSVNGAGFRGHGGHGFHGDGHFRHSHGDHFRSNIIVGVGPVWVDPWLAYPYPYDTVVVQQPQEYIYTEPQGAESWYYCRGSGQYYQYVTNCPEGWMKVVAPPSP